MPRARKNPVPPPGPDDVYLDVHIPEVLSAAEMETSFHNGRVFSDGFTPTRTTTNHLRLTPSDQRFLKKFGIRVP